MYVRYFPSHPLPLPSLPLPSPPLHSPSPFSSPVSKGDDGEDIYDVPPGECMTKMLLYVWT